MTNARHVNQFVSNCIHNQWAGVFYSPPFQTDFHFILHDLNHPEWVLNDYFLFHPFDIVHTPVIKLRADYSDADALELLSGLPETGSIPWTNANLSSVHSTEFDAYREQFEKYQLAFNSGKCEKAILSTITREELSSVNYGDLVFRLRQAYPQSYIYLLSSPIAGTWVGATPEIFLAYNHKNISTMSLAGTRQKSIQKTFGGKEIDEQNIVTTYISNFFDREFGNVSSYPPNEMEYGEMIHLLTRLDSTLTSVLSRDDLFDFARRYHPTPAVGGYPKSEALQLIKKVEKHPRLYYSGFMGMMYEGSAQLMVNLRCMAMNHQTAFIFAGGGITSQSLPHHEWDETRMKARALIKFLHQS